MELSRVYDKLQTLERSVRQIDNYYMMSKRYQDELYHIRNSQNELRKLIQKLECQIHIILLWKNQVDNFIEQTKQQLTSYKALHSKLVTTEGISSDLILLIENFKSEQLLNKTIQLCLKQKIEKFKETCVQEDAVAVALWDNQERRIDSIVQDINNLNKCLKEQNFKYVAEICELKASQEISKKTAQKIGILEREFIKVKTETLQLKYDLDSMKKCNNNQTIITERTSIGKYL